VANVSLVPVKQAPAEAPNKGKTPAKGSKKPVASKDTKTDLSKAPTYFRGTFRHPSSMPLNVLASLVYENKMGTNPPDSLFPSFPQMSLQISTCGSANARNEMELVSINPRTSQAVFTNTNTTTGQVFEFDATFTAGFAHLSGKIFSVLDGSSDNTYYVDLNSTGSSNAPVCTSN
jgi:hypothetical protein